MMGCTEGIVVVVEVVNRKQRLWECLVVPLPQSTNNRKPASHGQPESSSIGAATSGAGGGVLAKKFHLHFLRD